MNVSCVTSYEEKSLDALLLYIKPASLQVLEVTHKQCNTTLFKHGSTLVNTSLVICLSHSGLHSLSFAFLKHCYTLGNDDTELLHKHALQRFMQNSK